ncbi:MAG TPA: hypothetical protein VHW44_00450 [Pseudonocardiaceae bacterium]|jgi:hypothetical protein|nr:hypothetical protein [Pseudonocardiaceae bacterium]
MTSDASLDKLTGRPENLEGQLDAVTSRLARDYTSVSPRTVRSFVRDESDRFADARVHAFIPVLVERAVRDRLASG